MRTIKSYVGYAIKSRQVLFGVNNIVGAFGRKIPTVVLYDEGLGESSKDKLLTFIEKNGIESFSLCIEDIYPDKNCKAIGVFEKNLATAIINRIRSLQNE